MKKLFSLSLILLSAFGAMSQSPSDACTSIMVGKKASTDGSVMTSHTCDSWYRTWMQMTKPQDYPNDTIMSIYDGRMHTEYASSKDGMKEKGTIPRSVTRSNSWIPPIRALMRSNLPSEKPPIPDATRCRTRKACL